MIETLLGAFQRLPPVLIYLILGAGAAVENVVPPIPADTFVLLGAFLADRGRADVVIVFLVTWLANVISAVGVYALARKWGRTFFQHGAGRFLLRPHQLESIGGFYERFGVIALLVSRFLPGFRAMVPVFAGVTRRPVIQVVPPVAIASGLWYGMLVWLGAQASRNWSTIVSLFGRLSGGLGIVAGALAVAAALWWWRSRRP